MSNIEIKSFTPVAGNHAVDRAIVTVPVVTSSTAAPVATEDVVENNDTVNVVDPIIANAPDDTRLTAGPDVTDAPIATGDVVENNDTVNVIDPIIANAPEVTSSTAGPGVTDNPPAPATVVDTKTTRTRSEKTIKTQIYTNAMKYLTELANKAFEAGNDYVAPTEAQIRDECKKRWQKHLDLHAEKKDVSVYF